MTQALTIHGVRRGPLVGLVDPEGHAGYLLAEPGTWAVEAGPIADARFRRAALDLMEQALVAFDRPRAEKLLVDDRVQVVVGISQGAAERFAKRLGPQATGAKAVPTAALAKPDPWRGGLPVLALVAGVAFGWFAVAWWLGLVLGGGAATAAYTMGKQRSVPVLGTPPEPPPLPGSLLQALEAIRTADRPNLRAGATALLRAMDQLLDGEDFLSTAAGGVQGALGQRIVALLLDLARIARGAADLAPGLSQQAQAFSDHLPSLSAAVRAEPGRAAEHAATAEQELDALASAVAAQR